MPRGSAILHSEACGNCTCTDAAESAVIMQPQDEVQKSLSSPFPCNQDARDSTNEQWGVTDLTCVYAPSLPPRSYSADVAAAVLEAKRPELQSQLQGSRQPHVQHAALAQ